MVQRYERPPRLFLTPSNGFPFLVSASLLHLTSSSIIHNSQSSLNCCRMALHCMHQCPAMDSFPEAMAWKAKSPVTKTLVMGMWLGVAFLIGPAWGRYLATSTPHLSSLNICSSKVAIISSPSVNLGSIVCSSRPLCPFCRLACRLTPQSQ